jgi:hypothetical protein
MKRDLQRKLEIDRPSDWPAVLLFVRAYWQSKCGTRLMPARNDISPVQLKPQLPHIMLVDVVDEGADFRYRLVGTQLCDHFEEEPSGKLMSEVLAPRGEVAVRETLQSYRTVIARRAPLRLTGSGAWYGQESKQFDALLAPLSDDGETVNMILATFVFEWDRDGEFRQILTA